MPKAISKSAPKAPAKKITAAKAKPVAKVNVEKATEAALNKLKALNLEPGLQADMDWCLGSYRADQNPVGLYQMIRRSVDVFKIELKKKTKGVTAKLITDLEKVLPAK